VASTYTQSAGDFWQGWLARHHTIAGLLATIGAMCGFIFNGHIIVFGARWLIRVCGYIAEGALLFAVLWISAASVAPGLVELFMSHMLMQYFVWLALVALALIPEVILGNAIVATVGHWRRVADDSRNVWAWSWACLFSMSTTLFFVLTAITINQLTSHDGNVVQAGAWLLGFRCFAGWTYGLLQFVYVATSRPVQKASANTRPSADLTPLLSQIAALTEQINRLQSEQKASEEATPEQRDRDASPDVPVPSAQQKSDAEISVPTDTQPKSAQRESAGDSDAITEVLPTVSRRERNTQPLSQRTESDALSDTEPLQKATQKASPQPSRGEGARRAQRIMKRHPEITPTELAKRANISRSYASQVLSQRQPETA
jgi:hypothetical protein